jgi:hypothetical protein
MRRLLVVTLVLFTFLLPSTILSVYFLNNAKLNNEHQLILPSLSHNNKPTIVEVWSNGCKSCVLKFNAIKEMSSYEDFNMVLVYRPWGNTTDKGLALMRDKYFKGFTGLHLTDSIGRFNDPKLPVPQTYIFDKSGNCVYADLGYDQIYKDQMIELYSSFAQP